MNSLNSILLEGRLTADPVSRTSLDGRAYTDFTVESERFYKNPEPGSELEREASRFQVKASGRLGQSCLENLHEGRGVRVVGRLATHDCVAVDDEGNEYTPVYIFAEHVEFKPAGEARA